MAKLAESFDRQLREHGEGSGPSELDANRLAAVLELMHATLKPGSTNTGDCTGDLGFDFSVPGQVGRFKVGSEVGRGGFGVVYRAHDELLHRDVALKAIPRLTGNRSTTEDLRLREARAAARLNHPNLVPLYEVLEDQDCLYLISEYVEGCTLAEHLRKVGGPLDPRVAAEITLRIGQAVAHAHQRGFVHRDIKPSNVLLMQESVTDDALPFTPRLTDFGLMLEASGTSAIEHPRRLAGTLKSMAPEQLLRDQGWDARLSDVYALGLLLYRMLAGRSPFPSTSVVDLVQEICTQPVPRLRTAVPSIPVDLEAVCLKAMHRLPDQRYPTASDFVDDLVRWREGQPVSARTYSMKERVTRVIQREPRVASLAIALIALALFSSLVLGWSNEQLRRQGAELQLASERASQNESKATQAAFQADMTRAFSAVAQNNHSSAAAMIAQMEGYVSNDHRDRFDFRLLQTLTRQDRIEIAESDGVIEEVVYIPTADTFAVGTERGGVYFVRLSDRSIIGRYPLPDQVHLQALAVSPDGGEMAVGTVKTQAYPTQEISRPSAVELVELRPFWEKAIQAKGITRIDRKPLRTWEGFEATVNALAFSTDGSKLAIGPRYESIEVMNVFGNAEPLILAGERRNEDLSFSSNHELAWVQTKHLVATYDLRESKHVPRVTLPESNYFHRARISPDGQRILTAIQSIPKAFLYATNDDAARSIELVDLDGEVRCVCFSPDSQVLAVGTVGGSVATWDIPSIRDQLSKMNQSDTDAQPLDTLAIPADHHNSIHDSPVTSLAITDDGLIMSGSAGSTVSLSNGNSEASQFRQIDIPQKSCVACASSDASIVFYGCQDGSIWSMDTRTGRLSRLRAVDHSPVSGIAISPDARWLVAGLENGEALIYEIGKTSDWRSLPYEHQSIEALSWVDRIVFNAASTGMLIIRGTSLAQWIDIITEDNRSLPPQFVEKLFYHAPTSIGPVGMFAEKSFVSFDDHCYRFDVVENGPPMVLPGILDICMGCFDSNTRTMVLGSRDGRLRKVTMEGKLLKISQRLPPYEADFQEVRKITAITLSPCGQNIITGNSLGEVGIWDSKTLRYLGVVLPARNNGAITMLRVSEDASRLIAYQSVHKHAKGNHSDMIFVLTVR